MSSSLTGGAQQKRLAGGAAIVAVCALTVGWSLIAGKDLNWDQRNYHFYSAYSFVTERLSQDFMAANVQSYFNPLPYLPFYGMVRQGWHSVVITSVLACVHALNIVLAYLIAKEIGAKGDSFCWAVAGAVLAFLSPVFLFEAGTTFADISTAILVLLAVLLVLKQKPNASWWRHYAFLAGLAGGAAAGLKLTNAVYAPALAVMLIFMPFSVSERVRAIALLAVGGIAGAVVMHGYWSYLLWQEFKNPFFPLFNALFASPDYPLINHRHERFLPDGWWSVLRFPFDAMSTRERVYVESSSPDLRFAALYVLTLVGVAAGVRRYLGKSKSKSEAESSRLLAFLVFILSAFVLWMWTSGNGRYGLIVSVLIGPATAVWASRIFNKRKYAWVFLTVLITVQAIHLQHGRYRWETGHWTASWYDEIVPDELKQEPYLYLSIGRLSNAFVAPLLSQQSAFINPVGQMPVDIEGPGGHRVAALLKNYNGKVRMLGRILSEEIDNGAPSDLWFAKINAYLTRFNMVVDSGQCLMIKSDGRLDVSTDSKDALPDRDAFDRPPYRLITCALKTVAPDEKLVLERRRIEAVVGRIIAWCPKMFKPPYAVVEHRPDGWDASFEDSDMRIHIRGATVFMLQRKSFWAITLGRITDWEAGVHPRQDCSTLPRNRESILSVGFW